MCRRIPWRGTFGPNRFEYIFYVFGDGDFFPWFGFGSDFEDIRKCIIAGIVIDYLDAALFVMFERAETGLDRRHNRPPSELLKPLPACLSRSRSVAGEAR